MVLANDTCPLLLRQCCFDQPINLKEAQAASIRFPGCHAPGVAAYHLHTKGNLELNKGFTAPGNVGLQSAHIGGSLRLAGARLANPGGQALTANQLTVGENMSCEAAFTAEGEYGCPAPASAGSSVFRRPSRQPWQERPVR